MPFFEIEPELLTAYASGKACHNAHALTVELYKELLVHADGILPERLIECRRPSESLTIKDYRKEIFEPITEATFTRVLVSLAKIRRSPDWSITFPGKVPPKITPEESLETYTTENFPNDFGSLTNWAFSVGLKNYAIDSNAVVLVMPSNIDKEDPTEYYTPFPYVFNSPQVLEFVANDHIVLLSEETCSYEVYGNNRERIGSKDDGIVLYVVNTQTIDTYEQSDINKSMVLVDSFAHNLGYLPAFKMPGAYFKTIGKTFINKSMLAGMKAGMNEAVRQYSDMQAEIVQHVHSEKWIYQNIDCNNCNGSGKEQKFIGEICDCHVCHGIGKVSTSPYDNHVLQPPAIGESSVPTPPAGYIQKADVVAMVTKQNDLVNEQLYKALASINMQFLEITPLAQSGVAKEVDKDELNNFVNSIAEGLVKMMDNIYRITCDMRYSILIPDAAARKELLPKVAVPAVFDLLSSSYLVDEIKTAKESNINTLIILALEAEFAAKKFYNNPEVAQELKLTFNLDPIPGTTDDEKALRLQNEGVTQEDYIISCNIVPFIKRAIRENKKFTSLDYTSQMAILEGYAAEKTAKTAKQIMPVETVPAIPSNN
jgi:hypothetical protein